ncbi:MAG TPA: hypothetical protein VEO00_01355 [Actinomycetota bacterium]|nr:hypothetical protein [Actinomycetota bacterium]
MSVMVRAQPTVDVVRSGAHRGAELGREGAHFVAEMGRGAWEPIRERRERARRRERRGRMFRWGLIGLGGLAVGFLLGRVTANRGERASGDAELWEPTEPDWTPERRSTPNADGRAPEVTLGERTPA